MTKIKESFDKIVEIGDISKLFYFINDLSAEERQSLSFKAISWFKKASKGDVRARSNGTYGWEWSCGEEVLLTSVNAALALCSHEQLASANWSMALRNKIDLPMLARLKPVGMKRFGDILLEENVFFFSLVRDMMALDLCDKPTTERYYVGVIALPQLIYSYNRKYDTLKDLLLAERDILDDIWMLFEVEGNQEHSMSSVDKYSGPQANWDRALIELSEEGILSRERLLDASLEALTRNFIQFRSGWFSRFHEALKPTLEERLTRQETYLHLLSSSIPPTVSFAVKALKQISSKTSIDKEALKKNIAPALCAPTKSTGMAALALIEKTLKEDSAFRQDGYLLVAVALESEAVDVQKKALTILKKYGDLSDGNLLLRLEECRSVVSASVLVDLNKWCAGSSSPVNAGQEESFVQFERYVFDPDSSSGYPLKFNKEVEEIVTLDDLLARAAYCLEHQSDVLEFDRVMDACSRLPVTRDAQFEKDTSALRKRAKKFYDQAQNSYPSFSELMAGFLYEWLALKGNHNVGEWFSSINPAMELLRDKMVAILNRLDKNIYAPVLSSATNDCGWIDPQRLLSKYRVYIDSSVAPDETDMVLSLLRVSQRDLLQCLGDTKQSGDFIDVLRYVAGLSSKLPKASKKLTYIATFLKNNCPQDAFDFGSGPIITQEDNYSISIWTYSAIPVLRESMFFVNLIAAIICMEYLDMSYGRLTVALEKLMEQGCPLFDNAILILARGLVIGEPHRTGISMEAVIIAIDESRLPLDKFGSSLNIELHSERSKPRRLAKSLKEIALVGPVHANAVRCLIEFVLTGDGGTAPKGLAYVLELYYELITEEGVALEYTPTREYLESVKVGGKTGKLTKLILAK